MRRHHRRAHSVARRRPWPTVFAAVAVAAVAGCSTPAEPTANRAAPAVTSPAASPSRSADGAGTTSAADSVSAAVTSTSATAPVTSPATSGSTRNRTTASAPETTAAAPRTAAAADGTATSTVAAPSTSKRAPAAPTTSRSAPSSPRPPTTAVAPRTRGNIHETVPAETPVTLGAAPLTAQARPDEGVAVEVTNIRAMSTEARFPGEISGPGIAVTVRVVNSSAAAIDLDNAIVDVQGSDGTRAIAVTGSPAAPMSGSLPPGQQTSGVYVFTIPQDQRNPISVRFSYAAETPTVLFVGNAQ